MSADPPEGEERHSARQEAGEPPHEQQENFKDPGPDALIPPSRLVIEFAGPGSAVIAKFEAEGVVTSEQLASAGLFMITRAMHAWSVPVMQAVAENVIKDFLEELSKPRIEAAQAGFTIPPGMLRGKPS